MKTPENAYRSLVQLSRERAMLTSCLELLSWDELTYMPSGGVEYRGKVMGWLAGLDHKMGTDPQLGESLSIVEDSDFIASAGESVATNMRRWRREFDHLSGVPRQLVEELAAVTATAQHVWAEARQNNDFTLFAPWLQKVLDLKRREAQCRYGTRRLYDGLLQEYEPQMTTPHVRSLFEELRQELARLMSAIQASPRKTSDALLHREYPIDRQKLFTEAIAADVGFDFHRGRLDDTTHPFFAAVGPGDTRITTRYSTHDFGDGFFSMLHEMGHGLYEQGLDPVLYGTPAGEAPSTGIHESQSQFWEKFVGRDLPFWKHVFPRARDIFHNALHGVSVDEFHRALNHVESGWNRVRADPVTYDLHIMIRFELEVALLEGDLAVDDLPGAWNEACEQYMGLRPENDTEGCLQDSHWSAAMFGYFPVYTLGNIYGAQFYAAAKGAISNLETQIAQGEFEVLIEWLNSTVYARGGLDDAATLVERVSGRPPDSHALVEALWQRYRPIYDI